jgi:hypothetical protein
MRRLAIAGNGRRNTLDNEVLGPLLQPHPKPAHVAPPQHVDRDHPVDALGVEQPHEIGSLAPLLPRWEKVSLRSNDG